eukprot:INCI3207.7.p1 GENE.INCI3207.7~~INCI3207.7.p1  ORF type:complete len:1495 (-),score=259.90 INCI3207.7:63-4547(-)
MPPVNEALLGGQKAPSASHDGLDGRPAPALPPPGEGHKNHVAASMQSGGFKSATAGGGGAEPIPGDLSKLGRHLRRNGKASKVVLVDFDGPILPNGGSSSSVSNSLSWSQCGGREYKVEGDTSNRLLSNTLQVSNYIFLDLWFKILLRIPGVYVLPGSQRCAGYNCSEKSLLYTAYLDMYDLFDQFWGKDREFYRKEVGDFLARNVAAELLNYSKNYLLQAVRKIPEFAHLREKNICLIDDRRTYEGVAVHMGYHFIHCDRGPEEQVIRVARKFIHQHEPRKKGAGLSRKTNVLNKNQRVWALYPIPNVHGSSTSGGSATDEIPEGSRWHAAHVVGKVAKKTGGFGFIHKRPATSAAPTAAGSGAGAGAASASASQKDFLYSLQFEGNPNRDSQYLIDTISWAAKGNCTKTELLDIVRLVTRAQPTPQHLELWPKAKKIYQKFGKLVEKGVEDFFREQELQINAIRIEAILNGEKVHDVEAMRGRLRQIFSRLQPPQPAPSYQSLKVDVIKHFSEMSYQMHKAELQEYIQDMHTEYKARSAAARDRAQAQLENARQNEAASKAANAGADVVANVARALKNEGDELGLEMHMFVSAYLTAHPKTTFAETEQCVSNYFGHISMCVFRDLISRSFLAHELQRELEVKALKQQRDMKQGVLMHDEDEDTDGEFEPVIREEEFELAEQQPVEQTPATEDHEKPHASDIVANVALAKVAAHCLSSGEQDQDSCPASPGTDDEGEGDCDTTDPQALRHRRISYREVYFYARALLRAADPAAKPVTMSQLRMALVYKFGEPIADFYDADVEQLYMHHQVVAARAAQTPPNTKHRASATGAAVTAQKAGAIESESTGPSGSTCGTVAAAQQEALLLAGEGATSIQVAYGLGQLDDPPPTQGSAAVLDMARAQESPDTMAFISDVRSVTEALYALNFGGAGARLAAKEATRKLTTLFVFSDRQRCHFSLHNVPSSSRQYGEWVSGLRVQYDPSTVPRKVTLLSKRANAAGKSRTLESRGSPTFPSAASRKGGDKNAVVIAAAEAAAAHGRGLTSGPSHAAVTTAAAAKMSFGFAAYLEDVQQYPLDDVKHFVRALLDEMSRRKRRSSGAGTGTASAPNAAGNSSQLGGNTGPRTVNTSSSNGGRPSEQGPSMSSGSGQINISYYEAFRELRGRVEAQFNEFIFPLYANDIFRIVEEFSGSSSSSSGSSGSGTSRNGPAGNSGSGSGAPTQTSDGVSGSIKSTGSGEHSGNGTAQGGYPGDASTQKSRSQSTGGSPSSSADRRKRSKGGSSSSRLSITKSILSFAQAVVKMSPSVSDRQLEVICSGEFGKRWATLFRPALYEIYRLAAKARAASDSGDAKARKDSPSPPTVPASSSLLRVASLDDTRGISTEAMLSILSSNRNRKIASQLDRVVYIRAPDQAYAVMDRRTAKGARPSAEFRGFMGQPATRWVPVAIRELKDFQTGSLRIALSGPNRDELAWVFPQAPRHAQNQRTASRTKVSNKL